MNRRPTHEVLEKERKLRRRVVHGLFGTALLLCSVFLLWKLKALLLPILVGAFLAYLFRPLKDRFQVRWLHHELRVLGLFAGIGFLIFAMVSTVRQQLPDERQKLEMKVRIKYKLNEKFQEIVGTNNQEKRTTAVAQLIFKEAAPMMDQMNRFLDLDPSEIQLFLKYRDGHKGQPKIEDKVYDFFQANQTTSAYMHEARSPSALSADVSSMSSKAAPTGAHGGGILEELSIWILTPLIFIFLGFDNGQMRRYVIGLVPNRYFELSLQVLDMIDEAVGKYLRGTLLECALVGLTLTVGFILVGIPFSVAITIGLISGLVNAIPFLGTAIGMIIGLGYALIAEDITPLIPGLVPEDLAVYVIIIVIVAHLLDNAIFAPIVLGGAVNLHPLVVAVAIISGSMLAGLWGMLFAIPTVVVVKTAVETLFKELKDYNLI